MITNTNWIDAIKLAGAKKALQERVNLDLNSATSCLDAAKRGYFEKNLTLVDQHIAAARVVWQELEKIQRTSELTPYEEQITKIKSTNL